MTRSRQRKIARDWSRQRSLVLRRSTPVAATLLAAMPGAYAADESVSASEGLAEVVVTAQKRVENLQDVPISVQVFDNRTLEQLGIVNLYDYVQYSPSVSFLQFGAGSGGNGEPGSSLVYIRGVVSGGDGNESGSQPSVGMYLDEIPVTTVDGNIDIHIYDMQRIEVLEGPQGTLFGASSESGTIRLISNKPDPTKFSAGYDVKGDYVVDHTGGGYELEGFVNIPITDWIAVRLVGWLNQDPGTISNVAGTNQNGCIVNGVRTFPSWAGQPAGTWSLSSGLGAVAPCPAPTSIGAGSITNAAFTSNDYNTVITRGGRGAVKFDLGSDWTVTPSVVAQDLSTKGFFGYDPAVGDLELAHFGPESSTDSFYLTALTVEGKVNNFDIVDAAGFFKRQTHSIAEYSDYSDFYDRVYGSGAYWVGNNGKPIDPQDVAIFNEYYQKWSNEFRVSTPADKPVKATVGFFIQRQLQTIWKQYTQPGYGYVAFGGAYGRPSPNPDGLAQFYSIPNLDNTLWLTDEQRVDREKAGFAQVQWDITSQWSVQGGIRFYHYDNSLGGFYGYNSTYSSHTGMATCFPGLPPVNPAAPCTNLNTEVSSSGSIPKVTLTFKPTPDALVYATYSKGYRPGGVNRVSGPNGLPYAADYLQNYEFGWKTEWLGHRLRWNGALFWENWDDFQFAFLVPPSLTVVANGGNAVIKGLENTLEWAATDHLMASINFTFLDPYLTQNYCGAVGVTNCPNQVNYFAFPFPGAVKTPGGEYEWIGPLAPTGTNLPVTPKFKGNIVTRYTFEPISNWTPFAQAAFVYQSQVAPMLSVPIAEIIGPQPAFGLLDVSAGAQHDKFRWQLSVTNVTDKRAQLYRFTETNPAADNQVYVLPSQPRTIALTFAQRF
jgi:outer membrane receptor protein involved in Fe transport